jgi:methylthioribose-1-phosphate isomerase
MSVRTEGTAVEPLRFEDGALLVLDQRALPAEERWIRCQTVEQVADCIRMLAVRGAPAIGLAAAYALALADDRPAAAELLRSTRPTAVNLAWALDQCRDAPNALEAVRRLHREQHEADRRLAELGAELFTDRTRALTHCNAGALATGGFGTALGIIRAAHRRDPGMHVWVDETRPLLQGARLTAWELQQEDIAATLITDSTAAWLMAERKVDAVITGADRIARNGDTANKIGTYGLAVLARAHGLPFYVAAPTSTIDTGIESGREIPIEHRRGEEVAAGAAEGVGVYNPAFDVTPAEYVSAIVTERGVHRPPYLFT